MSKLFSSAEINLKLAKECYENSKKDNSMNDAYIAKTCYELQQSIEFNIKGLIDYYGNGIEYEHKHELEGNINKLYDIKNNISDFDKLDEILKSITQYVVTLNQWAKESRYNYNFKAVVNAIDDIFKIAEKLQNYTDELIKLSNERKC